MPNLAWKTLSPFEIAVGSESAAFGEIRRHPNSVTTTADVRIKMDDKGPELCLDTDLICRAVD